MTVDIIIPCYNCEDTLNKALASIATQKVDAGDSIKVTLVNDKSTTVPDYHNFVDYWAELIDIEEIDKEVNDGCGQARQTGMDSTDGDFFMFLDADDVLGSPFAVRALLRNIGGNDLVMGQFIEETADGHIITHEQNMIWCHGKLYRRRTIERFNLRFNMTRGNEDVGFHSVLSKLTDKVAYIHQTVYIWQNQNNSLVRNDANGYSHGYGWRDFIENIAWACEELARRDINKGLIRELALLGFVRIYFQYQEAMQFMPKEKKENTDKVIDFYERAVRPIVLDGGLPYEMISAQYLEMRTSQRMSCVPRQTLKDYLKMCGYYEDIRKAEENDTEYGI